MDDVVLIYEDKIPRNRWRIGIVDELFEGRDKFIRGVRVRTLNKSKKVTHLNRPINRLYSLEISRAGPKRDIADAESNKLKRLSSNQT